MGIVDVVVEWRRQCEIDPTGPRRGIVADVAERGGGSVDCTCSEYGDLTVFYRITSTHFPGHLGIVLASGITSQCGQNVDMIRTL